MRYLIDNRDNNDPAVNLALEEHCLKNLEDGHQYVLLYRNDPSVVVGRNQNIFQEIDSRFVEDRRMPVVRRLSGGGAVYHDRGNLNFGFIQKAGSGRLQDIRRFLAPVLRALQHMGVGAGFNARNDLVAGSKKISGSARFSNTHRVMVHGTLLFDANLQALSRALNPPAEGLLTRAIRSVPHPVANIRPLLDRPMDLIDFKQRLLALLSRQMGRMKMLSFNDRQWERIHQLAADKYRSWDWTFGRTPDFSIVKNGQGNRCLRIDVHRGKITAIADLASSNGNGIWHQIEKQLTGTRYERSEIEKALKDGQLDLDSPSISVEKLADDLWYN